MKESKMLPGFGIVVLDRGFIYVGHITHNGEWCVVENAKNIRRWGTTRGLGELALSGPTKDTVIDDAGTVRVASHALIHILDTDESKWKS